MAALASPGPIARARSAPVAPAGSRFSLPSGSVTRISRAVIDSVDRLVGRCGRRGGGGRRKGRQRAAVAKIQRQREGSSAPIASQRTIRLVGNRFDSSAMGEYSTLL